MDEITRLEIMAELGFSRNMYDFIEKQIQVDSLHEIFEKHRNDIDKILKKLEK